MTVLEFLEARLAEDEARAQAMGHRTDPEGESGYYACPATRTEPLGDLEWGPDACDCGLAARQGRALREVAAKQAIVGHAAEVNDMDLSLEQEFGVGPQQTGPRRGDIMLRDLAAVYADHPDYVEEWRP